MALAVRSRHDKGTFKTHLQMNHCFQSLLFAPYNKESVVFSHLVLIGFCQHKITQFFLKKDDFKRELKRGLAMSISHNSCVQRLHVSESRVLWGDSGESSTTVHSPSTCQAFQKRQVISNSVIQDSELDGLPVCSRRSLIVPKYFYFFILST